LGRTREDDAVLVTIHRHAQGEVRDKWMMLPNCTHYQPFGRYLMVAGQLYGKFLDCRLPQVR